ncbi:sensor histidine kinase [Spongiactinospora rosea]|uniref:histidine kinase n=1 Tax=Spongiactinospora rosea TaxID=2248750 RepID=A0A366M1K1_9ACTN|nr:ATP-binding protein [Spongiactinospora rosea]RBQ19683.1 sensor histidine kinase [Spongiactinospora rosea]
MGLICAAGIAVALIGVRDLATGDRTDEIAGASIKVVHLLREGRLTPTLTGLEVPAVQVVNARGRVLAATPEMAGAPRMADFEPTEDEVRALRLRCDVPGYVGECMLVMSFRVHQPEGDWLVYGADHDVPWYVSPLFSAMLLGGALLLLLVTTTGTYRVIGKTLAPVDAIRSELDEISATDLGRRVPVPPYQDEIRRLAESVNRTLDRLETQVEKQRRFASDASHDLRSPITAMRTQVEDALLHPGDTDWISLARAQLGSLERLEALVSDLLMLARLDAGAPSRRDRLDLSELVRGELDRRWRRVRVVRKLQDGVEVLGDRLRLARLLTNLVDNAERHAGTEICVVVGDRDGHAVLEVLDDGTGIPADQREVVFQRFTRLDAARSRDAGGTGLGLPIAREIAEEHGGSLTVEDSPRGARFVARFPSARR